MSDGIAIEVKKLVKKFGSLTAVNGISFNVREGEIFGFLGPNGAGKTTTISMITTILSPTSGSIKIYGTDVAHEKDAARQLIGIVFQEPSLDDELTGWENLDFHARLYGVKKDKNKIIASVIKLVGLEQAAKRQVKTYSGGMKRRLEIARGFIHKPKILFLDEPTLGLDPQTRRKIWDYIKEINKRDGTTIMLTTHYLEEADALCSRIAIIDNGKIIRSGTSEELKRSLGGDVVRIGVDKKKQLFGLVKRNKLIKKIKESNDGLEITATDGTKVIPIVAKIADSHKINISYATIKRPSLEDVFIRLTGKSIRDETPAVSARFRAMGGMRR